MCFLKIPLLFALGPTHPRIQGYQGLFSWGVQLTAHLHLVLRSKNAWSYTSNPPIYLYGVVLS